MNARLYLSTNSLIPSIYARGPWTRKTTKLKPIRIIHYFLRSYLLKLLPYDSLLSHVQHHSNKVFVGDQLLFYKPSWSQQGSVEEIEKYSRIANSGLSVQERRTSRLYEMVLNHRGELLGLLWLDVTEDGTSECTKTRRSLSDKNGLARSERH
jgi:hypothetical protein